jgi:hypothetical protein
MQATDDHFKNTMRHPVPSVPEIARIESQTAWPQMKQPPVVQGVAGGCTSVRNPLAGVDGNRSGSLNHIVGNTLRDPVFGNAAVDCENGPIDPELVQVIDAWDTRTAIQTIVEAELVGKPHSGRFHSAGPSCR